MSMVFPNLKYRDNERNNPQIKGYIIPVAIVSIKYGCFISFNGKVLSSSKIAHLYFLDICFNRGNETNKCQININNKVL